MGSISDKLAYLINTKNAIKNAIINKGVAVPDETTFREYANLIHQIKGGGGGDLPIVVWTMPKLRYDCDDSYIITADSVHENRFAWRSFDGVVGDGINNCWHSGSSYLVNNSHWLKINTNRNICLKSLTFKNITGNYSYLFPINIDVYASNDDVNYVFIQSCDTSENSAPGSVHNFIINNEGFYKYYRFNFVMGTDLGNYYYAGCGEMDLSGEEKIEKEFKFLEIRESNISYSERDTTFNFTNLEDDGKNLTGILFIFCSVNDDPIRVPTPPGAVITNLSYYNCDYDSDIIPLENIFNGGSFSFLSLIAIKISNVNSDSYVSGHFYANAAHAIFAYVI